MRIISGLQFIRIFLFAAVPVSALADAKIVETGQTYPTISAAITAALPAATIEVTSGDYREVLVITKPVKLLGHDTGAGKPRIDAGKAT